MKHFTRFRAYRLTTEGSSMSLSVNDNFTLIEARYNDDNKNGIAEELRCLGKIGIDTLHITSWDKDHCDADELSTIINVLNPTRIEYPGYEPDSENGQMSIKIINSSSSKKVSIEPQYVNSEVKERLLGKDLFYNPYKIFESSNDNSVVKFFRRGSFQILSLGDCESDEISEYLQNDFILKKEVDVLILSHHGSTNSVVTPEFLNAIKPQVAICTVDYANKFGHPDNEMYNWLSSRKIKYLSTKSNDVIVETINKQVYGVYTKSVDKGERELVERFLSKTYYPNDEY